MSDTFPVLCMEGKNVHRSLSPELHDKIEEYISSGYVFGNATIFKNTYAVQAGELVVIEYDDIRPFRYFEFNLGEVKELNGNNISAFSKKLDDEILYIQYN